MIDIGPNTNNSNRLLYSLPIQATASRGMLSTRTGRRAHMTELTRVGLTCRAFARAGSKGGSHDRAHTGAGSHAGHSSWSVSSGHRPNLHWFWFLYLHTASVHSIQ